MSKGKAQPAIVRQVGPQTVVPNRAIQRNRALPAVIRTTGTQTVTPGVAR
jgi:hypothetical protein